MPWSRFGSVLLRYKWLILAGTLLGLGVGYVVSRFLPPAQYQATGSIWFAGAHTTVESGTAGAGPIRQQDGLDRTQWSDLLQSRSLLDNVVHKRHLYVHPANAADSLAFASFEAGPGIRSGQYALRIDGAGARYSLLLGDTLLLEQGAVGDSVGRRVGFQWLPPTGALGRGRTITFAVTTPDAEVAALRARTVVYMPRTPEGRLGNTAQFTLTGSDPRQTSATLNALIREYVATATELQHRNFTEAAKTLRSQLDTAAMTLHAAESALAANRMNTITLPMEAPPTAASGTQNAVAGGYFTDKTQRDLLERDRQAIDAALAYQNDGPRLVEGLVGIQAVQSSPELKQALDDLSATENQLRAARRLYTDEHPRVKALMDQSAALRTVQIPRLARVVTSQLQAREQELDRQLAIQGRQLQSIPPRVITQMRLQRDFDAKAALYNRLQTSYDAMKVAALSTPSEVSVLDTAVVPSMPIQNRTPQIVLIIVLASIGGAVGLAFLLDRADKRFRYPEQATHELGLVIVGAVPKIETKQNGGDPEEAAQVVEAFRTVRMNLQYAVDGSSSIMFTVSSPGPGDGKSLVASNLALSFAEAGHRVVLIDGDIRRGELHEMFGAARRPGLIDYLAGGVPLESILRETTHENLTLIPCGTRRHRGPELLQSSLLPALVESLQSQYEVIVVDSAPLSAGIDSFALGAALGNMLLVLRTGETDRHLAQTRLALLQRLPIRLLGVVLNDIRPEGAYRYYSYLYGYSLEDDGERVAQLASGPGAVEE